MKKGITVVIPAYNEEDNIAEIIHHILDYFKNKEYPYEIIGINDGSIDNTGRIADSIAKGNDRVKVIHHKTNEGYAAALKNGFKNARYQFLFFTDADRQFDVKGLDVMFPLIATEVVDMVIGYRLKRKDSAMRKFLSWGYNSLVGFLFDLNVKDIDCAFKIFNRKIFDKIHIKSSKFFINTEILVKARHYGFNIVEIGVPHFPRNAGKSTISLKYIPITLISLFKLWREMRRLKRSG
jgi:glycosyltransferase involved in cell wall biosynthesis